MNERIQELAEQAEKYADDNFKGENFWTQAYESKFAELIVRECAGLVRKHNYQIIKNEEPLYGITSTDILEHFGVESDVNENLRNRSTYFGNDI